MQVAHLYKITNKINGEYYIGKHNGWHQNGYWGSGKRIKLSVEKHGEENFNYDIICYGTPEYILQLEEKYVTLELIESDRNCLNLSAGGMGACRITEDTRKKLSVSSGGKNNPMFGKKHSKETKQKITNALVGKPLKQETKKIIGDIFSKRMWVNNGVENKRIDKKNLHQYIKNGFNEGRTDFSSETKQKISLGVSKLIWIHDDKHSLRVKSDSLDFFIEKGYTKGRGKKEITNG
jgi:group I intron endonuclease